MSVVYGLHRFVSAFSPVLKSEACAPKSPVTEFVRAFKQVERFVPTDELAGNVVWLDSWVE